MDTVETDHLVDYYLRRLDHAAAHIEPARRSELVAEIRSHIETALGQEEATGETAVRNVLDRLGPPEEIVSEATEGLPPNAPQGSPPETNSSAVVSLILGALWLVGIGSVLALIFGYRARREIKSSQPKQAGAGLATAGIVLGWVGIALLLVVAAGALPLVALSPGPMPVAT
jgi:hypothetical protein